MDIFDFINYVTFFVVPAAVYFLLFKDRINIRFNTNRDWLYFIKYLFAYSAVKEIQKKCKLAINEETKRKLENPKKIQSDNYEDNHFIYGVDQNGNNLSIRFTICSNLIAKVFICLRLWNGAVYTFPGDKILRVSSISNWKWKTNDLNIEILEPYKRLRITFHGLLSNANRNVEYIQFNFIWTAAGAPQFYPQDAATSILADSLARHRWRDGDWITHLGGQRGYGQFGALKGFIKGDSILNELLLNLPSCRTRFWGINEKLTVNRAVHVFVVGKDGALINLWIKSMKNGCKQLQYGYILTNVGKIFPISTSNIRLDALIKDKTLSTDFVIDFTANKIKYRNSLHLISNYKVASSKIDPDISELLNSSADCDLNTQEGKSLVEFWNCGRGKTIKVLPPPLLLTNKTKAIPSYFITKFEDEDAKIVRLTGGKGSSIALLTSLKSNEFTVPSGFIVTVNAFNQQLESNFNMKKAVAILDDVCCGRSKGNLEQACIQTVQTFKSEKILIGIKRAIIQALRGVKRDPTISVEAWAVRSSAVGEDSEELSAAGQNETFLGCTTVEDVLQSISSCWASLFSFQSVQYRHKHGLPVTSEMAVVVQRMIPADCAGILFTLHPSTGNPAQIVITANHGLGESVVSGRSEPDTIILQRTFDNDLTLKSKALGSKKKMIKMVIGGTEEVDGIEEFCLSDNQSFDLARVAIFLEQKFGSARDIEWGFYQGQLFILQVRPITTLNTWSNYELSHEFDVAALSNENVYTIANTGEVLPGAISVLTLSTLVKGLDAAIHRAIDNTDDPHAFQSLSIFQHHLFIDVVTGIHRLVGKNISLDEKILDLAIFGHPIINEKIHLSCVHRFGVATPMKRLTELLRAVKIAWNNEKHLQLSRKIAISTEIGIDKHRDTLQDIYTKISNSLETFIRLAQLHCFTTRTSIIYQYIIMRSLAGNSKDFTVDHYTDVAMLLASCEEVISAEIPTILANITKILAQKNQTQEFIKIKSEDGQQWLQQHSPEAAKLFENFLKDHGHRGVREFDMYNKTWQSTPNDVIKMIQTNCKMAATKQEKSSKSIEEVISLLKTAQSWSSRMILKNLMKKSRRAVGIREQTKSETIRYVNKLRNAYRFLGYKMKTGGLIPDSELIFHLSHYEIGQIVNSVESNPVLIIKALKRRKLYPKWDQLKFPEISYGIPKYESRDFKPRIGTGKVKCEGTPVCSGIIQARACVITDLSEIEQLEDGDILITYCTDIGWSPYFPMLAGIVTELGGLVSHGAVIAREYGLPCIVGAKDATKFFKTGDNVILSGEKGTIELIS